jgi:SAM-dependent methyltransferase
MWWHYDQLESGHPYDWTPAGRGESEWDNIDFHVDLGCGTLRKGRLGIDRYYTPNVDLLINFDRLAPAQPANEFGEQGEMDEAFAKTLDLFNARIREENEKVGLPFPTNSIESIISHHCFEHLGIGFIPLMDECHRVLKPGGILRVITPLFPSRTAVEDPDHKRWIMEGTFEAFCGTKEGESWLSGFSVPYTSCRFEMVDKDITKRLEDPQEWWGVDDAREIRVALRKHELVEEAEDVGEREIPARERSGSRDEDEVLGAAEVGGDGRVALVA